MAKKYKYYKFTYTEDTRQPSLNDIYRVSGRGTKVSYYSFREGKWVESLMASERELLIEASSSYRIEILSELELQAQLSMMELVS